MGNCKKGMLLSAPNAKEKKCESRRGQRRRDERRMSGYRFIYKEGKGELVEKKSRFLAQIVPIATPEEAQIFVAEKKKEYWDARHNCYAYVIGEHQENTRCSDDGEPAGTAGRPMLDVLLKEDIHNAAVVVTRYFGGVLLGTGGLVRAYQGAVINALKNARILVCKKGKELTIAADYSDYGKAEYVLRELEVPVEEVSYGAEVVLNSVVPLELTEPLSKLLMEKTAAKARLVWGDTLDFAQNEDGEIVFKKSF